jgi:hypothetical protein
MDVNVNNCETNKTNMKSKGLVYYYSLALRTQFPVFGDNTSAAV